MKRKEILLLLKCSMFQNLSFSPMKHLYGTFLLFILIWLWLFWIPVEGLRDQFVILNTASVEQRLTQQSRHPGQASDGREPGHGVMKGIRFSPLPALYFLCHRLYSRQAHRSNISVQVIIKIEGICIYYLLYTLNNSVFISGYLKWIFSLCFNNERRIIVSEYLRTGLY